MAPEIAHLSDYLKGEGYGGAALAAIVHQAATEGHLEGLVEQGRLGLIDYEWAYWALETGPTWVDDDDPAWDLTPGQLDAALCDPDAVRVCERIDSLMGDDEPFLPGSDPEIVAKYPPFKLVRDEPFVDVVRKTLEEIEASLPPVCGGGSDDEFPRDWSKAERDRFRDDVARFYRDNPDA